MNVKTWKPVVKLLAGGACAALIMAAAGCSKPNAGAPQSAAPAGGAPAASGQKSSITIKGSDTMVHLVSAWAEAYMDSHPGADVSVTGGGSGTGIAALLNGTTDICMASRDISPEEAKKAKDAGVTYHEHSPALDGIAVVVNPGNPLTELTMEQLGKIFTGEVTNWKDVGGADQKIQVVSRESSSGTYVFFQEHVLKKKDYAASAMLLPATSAIVQSVASDATNIGYVGLGYEESAKSKVKAIGIKATPDAPAVLPSITTVKDASYPIARKLNLYVAGKAVDAAADFVAFCESAEGQKIVVDNGYVPIN